MRISDWSSDVRSSDLLGFDRSAGQQPAASERRDRRHGQPHPAKCRHGGAEHGRRAQPCFGSEPTPEAGQPFQYKPDRKRETSPGRNAATNGCRRSEEHTSELQSLMRISYAVFCLKKKNKRKARNKTTHTTTEV